MSQGSLTKKVRVPYTPRPSAAHATTENGSVAQAPWVYPKATSIELDLYTKLSLAEYEVSLFKHLLELWQEASRLHIHIHYL